MTWCESRICSQENEWNGKKGERKAEHTKGVLDLQITTSRRLSIFFLNDSSERGKQVRNKRHTHVFCMTLLAVFILFFDKTKNSLFCCSTLAQCSKSSKQRQVEDVRCERPSRSWICMSPRCFIFFGRENSLSSLAGSAANSKCPELEEIKLLALQTAQRSPTSRKPREVSSEF